MPITELVLLSFNQDEATRKAFSTVLTPALNGVLKGSRGVQSKHVGKMLSSNGLDVSSSFKPVMGLGVFILLPVLRRIWY
jgi:hypothetical protein